MRGLAAAVLLAGVSTAPALAQSKPAPAPSKAADPTAPSPATGKRELVTFGVQPASAAKEKGKLEPDTRPLFSYGVTPSGLLNDHVAFRNYSSQPITVRIYATDSKPSTNGDFTLLDSGQKPVDVGSWVTLVGVPQGVIEVPAESYKIVPLRLKVPRDAQPGDHTGAVMASYDTVGKNKEGAIVRLEQRVGSRLRVRVSGPLRPKLLVEPLTARYERPGNPVGKGRVHITYKVTNVGNVRLSGRQSVRVKGWFGAGASAHGLQDLPELLPGSSFDVSTVVPMAGVGRLSVTAEVVPVTPPGDDNPAPPTTSKTVKLWALTWIWLLALLIVSALIWLRWKRGRTVERAMTGTPGVPRIAPTPKAANAGRAGEAR
ncbi:MAG: DUF916 domain-containing protein [Mycobacteriales bacterium]